MWILPKNYPLSLHFVQDMVESKEDLTLPGLNIESSLMWRSKPTALPTLLRRWKRVSWLQHLCTRILKPSRRKSFETALTSSLAVIPANLSHKQGTEKEAMIQDTCGHTYGDTSNQLDLFGSSLKMSKDISRLDSPQSLAIWKKMVSDQRLEYSQRLKSVHPISGKGSGSWATPNTMDHLPQRSEEALMRQASTTRKGRTRPANLREQVNPKAVEIYQANWPTATVFDVSGGTYPTELVNGQWRSKHSKDPNSPWYGAKLKDAVEAAEAKWPTPAARDYKGTNAYNKTMEKIADGKRANMGQLPNAVMVQEAKSKWPTPTARDYKGASGSGRQMRKGNPSDTLPNAVKNWPTPDVAQAEKVSNRPNYGQVGLANHPDVHGTTVQRDPMQKDRLGQPGQDRSSTNGKNQEQFGKLNPNWVEQLMGLPIGWTDLGSWETE